MTMNTDPTVDLIKLRDRSHKGQYAIQLSLSDLANACHLRVDDTAFALAELGFLKHRRKVSIDTRALRQRYLRSNASDDADETTSDRQHDADEEEHDLGEWKDVEIVITREMVEEEWTKWRVREKGMLDEDYILL